MSAGISSRPLFYQKNLMKTILQKKISSLVWMFVICFFAYQMFQIVTPYTSWEWDVDFLITKQRIIHLDYYRIAFYSHIFTSGFILLCGAFLFSNFILKRYSKLHRWLGKTYVFLLLCIAAPSGMIMAFHANGSWFTQLSFFILTPLWWWFTWKGFQTVLQKRFQAHRIWMMRSYALTLSATSLRIYQLILGSHFLIDPVIQYTLVSWGSWVGNLMFIEWIIFSKKNSVKKKFNFSVHYQPD